MNYMLIIYNKDTLSAVSKIGIEPKVGKYYVFDKDDNVLLEENISEEQLARFLSVDPLAKDYPHNSPYAFSENDVIRAIDLESLEKLIVSNINKEDRTASLTIKKTALIVIEGINNIPQHGKFSSTALNSLFKRGNKKIFFKDLPQNGIENQFVERSDWKKGTAYKIDVNYDVNIKFVTADEANKNLISDPVLYSRVALGRDTFFKKQKIQLKVQVVEHVMKLFLIQHMLEHHRYSQWEMLVT